MSVHIFKHRSATAPRTYPTRPKKATWCVPSSPVAVIHLHPIPNLVQNPGFSRSTVYRTINLTVGSATPAPATGTGGHLLFVSSNIICPSSIYSSSPGSVLDPSWFMTCFLKPSHPAVYSRVNTTGNRAYASPNVVEQLYVAIHRVVWDSFYGGGAVRRIIGSDETSGAGVVVWCGDVSGIAGDPAKLLCTEGCKRAFVATVVLYLLHLSFISWL